MRRARNRLLPAASILLFCAVSAGARQGAPDLGFLHPWFKPDHEERTRLAHRGVVARDLPADGRRISVIAACAIGIDAETFVARVRSIGTVHHGRSAAGRFGDPATLTDVAGLSLDQGDIDRLLRCRRGECALNLEAAEMGALQSAFTRGAAEGQNAFRQMLVNRINRYSRGGLTALPDYEDRSPAVKPGDVFTAILAETPWFTSVLPQDRETLTRNGPAENGTDDSFIHWSKVTMNKKPVIMATHLRIVRPAPGPGMPAILVSGTQVYASRYMNGAFTLTMLFATGGRNYLVHVDRSDLDELGGSFTGLKRALIGSRIKSEAVEALAALRDRLEKPAR